MAFYYVCGQDQIYGGLHGMKYESIAEGNEQDAIDMARELAEDVISSFSGIGDSLEEEISDVCSRYYIDYENSSTWSEDDCDRIEEIREEIYEEDLDYFFIKLDETKLPSNDPYELEALLVEMGSEEFLNKYKDEEL